MGSRDHSETCDVCGIQWGGLNDLECDCDRRGRAAHMRQVHPHMLRSLGTNLAVAAALCEAWSRGWNACANYPRNNPRADWRPGCGRSAL